MYHFNEGSIDLPDEWGDKTIHVITSATEDTLGLSFTISRDVMPWGMTFSEYVEREIKSLSRQLTNYQQLDISNPLSISDKDAVMNEFTWDSAQGHMHQLVTFLDTKPQTLIFTATMKDVLTASQKEKIKTMLHSITLRASSANV